MRDLSWNGMTLWRGFSLIMVLFTLSACQPEMEAIEVEDFTVRQHPVQMNEW